MSAEPLAQDINNDSSDNVDLSHTVTASSQRSKAMTPFIIFLLGLIVVGTFIFMIVWLALHGPTLVPSQDTRITAIIISLWSRLAGLFICAAFVRSAWADLLQHVLSGEPMPIRTLVGICRTFMSFGQVENYSSLPFSFKCHVILAVFVSLALMGSSASFRYDSLELAGSNVALVPDVASLCNRSFVNASNYFCNYALNANMSKTSWDYLEEVYTSGQNTVHLYGKQEDTVKGANITLGILPAGWKLNNGDDLPWMAIWVTCHQLSISANFSGSGISTLASIFVDDTVIDILDVASMPEWGSIVHLYRQVNDSGPASSLSPWKIVMLANGRSDGTDDFRGLDPDALKYLGESYLDLESQEPTLQSIFGAAAWCEFNGSVGGLWPDELWPPLNHTSNVVIGTVIDDCPTMGTAMLNFGPSWQYNLESENSLPGGSVSFIANITGPGVSFPTLFSSYIRNQWSLTAYSIAPQSGQQKAVSFVGLGLEKLYISITIVSVLPSLALAIGWLVILRALVYTIRYRRWVNRVEFESWWLAKAFNPSMHNEGYCNVTEKDFINESKDFSVTYREKAGLLETKKRGRAIDATNDIWLCKVCWAENKEATTQHCASHEIDQEIG